MAKPKRTAKPAPKQSAKAPAKKGLSRADRAKILADMKSSGLTAQQAAKKYGISHWTIYGWKKSRNAGKSGKPAKKSGAKRTAAKSSTRPSGSLGETLRPLIAQIVREELARLVG